MSLTRALTEIKLISSKIDSKMEKVNPVSIQQGDKKINGIFDPEDFKKEQKELIQSIQDLIKQKAIIKSLIVSANATTKVKIAEKEMTIADAIVRKENISYEKELLVRINERFKKGEALLVDCNNKVKANLQSLLEKDFGKESSKSDPENIKLISDAFLKMNEFKLVEAISTKKVIAEMEKSIEDFESNVDFALSEINSQTLIEVKE